MNRRYNGKIFCRLAETMKENWFEVYVSVKKNRQPTVLMTCEHVKINFDLRIFTKLPVPHAPSLLSSTTAFSPVIEVLKKFHLD